MAGCEENDITKMKKQILHLGQNPEGDDTTKYDLFVKATGTEKEILQIKGELGKKLFQTELKRRSIDRKIFR